jgi:hypothetical protein
VSALVPEIPASPVVPAPADARRPAPSSSKDVIRLAWTVVLLISAVPAVLSTELTGDSPPWLPAAQIGVLIAVLLGGLVWPVARALRRFALAMIALLLLLEMLARLDLTWMPLQSLFGGTAFDARMQAEQTGKFLVTLTMIGVLLLLGYRRRDFFLAVGDFRAPMRPVRLLGFPRPDPWWRFGLQWSVYIAGALALALFLTRQPGGGAFAAIVPMLPAILFYAACNAVHEELTYRAPMLATLEPVQGSTQALWQSAAFFGIAHYFGTPGGLLGAGLSVFMGWLLGKAMVETRGLFWAWWIHFLSDVVIFTFMAADLVT